MKLGVWSAYYIHLSPEEAMRELKSNGISFSELSDEHGEMLLKRGDPIKVGKEFSKFLDEIGMEVSQGHLWLKCAICEEGAISKLIPWIDLYEAIGIKYAVLHCDGLSDSGLPYSQRIEKNISVLSELAKHLKGRSIVICLENLQDIMKSSAELIYTVESIGSENFGICLDTGHLNVVEGKETQKEFILKTAKYLKALHLHDNEGERDQHIMPFARGNVDFFEIYGTLRRIGYTGMLNYEMPGERWSNPPLSILGYKLEYLRKCHEYLISASN